MTPDDLPVPAPTETVHSAPARRRATLAALLGLAAIGAPARAQMGGGGGGRMRGQQQDGTRPDKDSKDSHADAAPPRDLVAAFAMRLREGVPDLALAPPQQPAFRDFVASLAEVGQHNERRLQRILWRSTGSVSAVAPLKSFIAAEVDEGQARQEALADLKLAYEKLDTQLDERQRNVLAGLFVATRSELQAPRT